jgi:hypothetical protein
MGEGGEWAGKEERHALGPNSFLNLERVFHFCELIQSYFEIENYLNL